MRAVALLALVGSVVCVALAAVVGRQLLAAAQGNIRRYSMPGPVSYDLAARLLFRDRYREIAGAIADEVPPGSRLLDVGCGPGEVLNRLATLAPGIETTGLDVDEAMIDRAQRKAARTVARGAGTRPSFVVADVATMPFPDAMFDVVVSSFAVHHWPDRHAGMAEMMRVLRPGGRAIIWDIAPPHPTAADDPHGSGGHGHGSSGETDAPTPSVFHILQMLMVFRRLPAQRYEFTKPAG